MATAFLPYTIGKTAIIFVEEFNVTEDAATVVGIAELSAFEEKRGTTISLVYGTAIPLSDQIFDAIDENTIVGLSEIVSVDQRFFEDSADTVIGIADISAEEVFGLRIEAGATVVGTPTILRSLAASFEGFSMSGLTGGLSVRPRVPVAYRTRGYFVNRYYEILGINISDLLNSAEIIIEPNIISDISINASLDNII